MRELDPIEGQSSWHSAIGLLIEVRPHRVRAITLSPGYSTWRFSRSRRFGFADRRGQPTLARLFGRLASTQSFPARVTYAVWVEPLNFRFFWSAPRATSLICGASAKGRAFSLEIGFKGGVEDRRAVMHSCSSPFLSFWASL